VRKLVIAVVVWGAALPAWASEGSAETFLGLPVVLWKTLNFVGFFGLLAYLLAKPMAAFFRTRREGIGRQLEEATKQRQEAERLSAEMEQKVAALQGEITAMQERLRREGEKEREALESQGEAEAARFLAQVDQEAARRVEEARASLSREAAGVAAELAIELLEKELTEADRERIFTSTLERLKARAAGGVQLAAGSPARTRRRCSASSASSRWQTSAPSRRSSTRWRRCSATSPSCCARSRARPRRR